MPEAAMAVAAASVGVDVERLAAAARSDREAFARLYVEHRDPVYRYLRARCGPDDAADLTAETFERALRAVGRYRFGEGGFRPWLFRIARNAAIDHHRSQHLEGRPPRRAHHGTGPTQRGARRVHRPPRGAGPRRRNRNQIRGAEGHRDPVHVQDVPNVRLCGYINHLGPSAPRGPHGWQAMALNTAYYT